MAQTLRGRLKADTVGHHAAVDALLSSVDISTYAGLSVFVTCHTTCFRHLLTHTQGGAPVGRLADLSARMERDHAALDLGPVPSMAPHGATYDPQAVDYVVSGSHLGANVLRKRWARSNDPRVRAADNYFSVPSGQDHWRDLCADLAARPANGPGADRTVADAARIFALFSRTARTLLDRSLERPAHA